MRKLRKQELDTVGHRLFEAAGLDQAETDRIADSPELFRSVLRRIETVSREEGAVHTSGSTFRFRFLRGALSAAVLLAAAVVGSSLLFVDKGRTVSESRSPVPAVKPVVSRPVAPPPEPRDGDNAQMPTGHGSESRVRPERATFRTAAPASRPVRPQIPEIQETAEEFYPLTFAGDPYETARGGRVLRVEMPRSSLFAMGVDLSLENESESVKADLLIGPDGVARGVRIVR